MSDLEEIDVNALLPTDYQMLDRSKSWALLMQKHEKDTSKSIHIRDYVNSIENYGETDDSFIESKELTEYDRQTAVVPFTEFETVADKCKQLRKQRNKELSEKGFDKVIDSFSVNEIDKVQNWCKSNSKFMKIGNVCKDSKFEKRNFIEEIRLQENIFTSKNKDTDSDESVDTIKYILSNRKLTRRKITLTTIKSFKCEQRFMQGQSSKKGLESMFKNDLREKNSKRKYNNFLRSSEKFYKKRRKKCNRASISMTSSTSSSDNDEYNELERNSKMFRYPKTESDSIYSSESSISLDLGRRPRINKKCAQKSMQKQKRSKYNKINLAKHNYDKLSKDSTNIYDSQSSNMAGMGVSSEIGRPCKKQTIKKQYDDIVNKKIHKTKNNKTVHNSSNYNNDQHKSESNSELDQNLTTDLTQICDSDSSFTPGSRRHSPVSATSTDQNIKDMKAKDNSIVRKSNSAQNYAQKHFNERNFEDNKIHKTKTNKTVQICDSDSSFTPGSGRHSPVSATSTDQNIKDMNAKGNSVARISNSPQNYAQKHFNERNFEDNKIHKTKTNKTVQICDSDSSFTPGSGRHSPVSATSTDQNIKDMKAKGNCVARRSNSPQNYAQKHFNERNFEDNKIHKMKNNKTVHNSSNFNNDQDKSERNSKVDQNRTSNSTQNSDSQSTITPGLSLRPRIERKCKILTIKNRENDDQNIKNMKAKDNSVVRKSNSPQNYAQKHFNERNFEDNKIHKTKSNKTVQICDSDSSFTPGSGRHSPVSATSTDQNIKDMKAKGNSVARRSNSPQNYAQKHFNERNFEDNKIHKTKTNKTVQICDFDSSFTPRSGRHSPVSATSTEQNIKDMKAKGNSVARRSNSPQNYAQKHFNERNFEDNKIHKTKTNKTVQICDSDSSFTPGSGRHSPVSGTSTEQNIKDMKAKGNSVARRSNSPQNYAQKHFNERNFEDNKIHKTKNNKTVHNSSNYNNDQDKSERNSKVDQNRTNNSTQNSDSQSTITPGLSLRPRIERKCKILTIKNRENDDQNIKNMKAKDNSVVRKSNSPQNYAQKHFNERNFEDNKIHKTKSNKTVQICDSDSSFTPGSGRHSPVSATSTDQNIKDMKAKGNSVARRSNSPQNYAQKHFNERNFEDNKIHKTKTNKTVQICDSDSSFTPGSGRHSPVSGTSTEQNIKDMKAKGNSVARRSNSPQNYAHKHFNERNFEDNKIHKTKTNKTVQICDFDSSFTPRSGRHSPVSATSTEQNIKDMKAKGNSVARRSNSPQNYAQKHFNERNFEDNKIHKTKNNKTVHNSSNYNNDQDKSERNSIIDQNRTNNSTQNSDSQSTITPRLSLRPRIEQKSKILTIKNRENDDQNIKNMKAKDNSVVRKSNSPQNYAQKHFNERNFEDNKIHKTKSNKTVQICDSDSSFTPGSGRHSPVSATSTDQNIKDMKAKGNCVARRSNSPQNYAQKHFNERNFEDNKIHKTKNNKTVHNSSNYNNDQDKSERNSKVDQNRTNNSTQNSDSQSTITPGLSLRPRIEQKCKILTIKNRENDDQNNKNMKAKDNSVARKSNSPQNIQDTKVNKTKDDNTFHNNSNQTAKAKSNIVLYTPTSADAQRLITENGNIRLTEAYLKEVIGEKLTEKFMTNREKFNIKFNVNSDIIFIPPYSSSDDSDSEADILDSLRKTKTGRLLEIQRI